MSDGIHAIVTPWGAAGASLFATSLGFTVPGYALAVIANGDLRCN